jgi:hypothetical protein
MVDDTTDQCSPICRQCVGAGPEGLRTRLLGYIGGLRADVEMREERLADPFVLPTIEQWDMQLIVASDQGEAAMDDAPAPASNSFGTMQYAGLPDEFGTGYAGYDADDGPAADDPVWAQALPAPPMLDVRGHEPNEDERRADLLADAARKPVRHLMQFDVFQSNFDDIVRPDEDGDCLFWRDTYELRRSDIVRVQFPVGYDRDNAVRALRKIADFIKEGVDLSGETP